MVLLFSRGRLGTRQFVYFDKELVVSDIGESLHATEATVAKLLFIPTSSKEWIRKLGREVFSPLQEANKRSSQRTTSFVLEGKSDSSFEIKRESTANSIKNPFL